MNSIPRGNNANEGVPGMPWRKQGEEGAWCATYKGWDERLVTKIIDMWIFKIIHVLCILEAME